MAVKVIRKLSPPAASRRARIIGLRLRDEDRRRFERMARSAGVGVSTYARLIIEQYIETHGPRSKP
jgi:hypothetical protein